MDSSQERMDRLWRALDAFEEHRRGGGQHSEDDVLDRHADLRDLLEPMLRGGSTPADVTVASPELSSGDRIGPYRVLEEVGGGGMGSVFAAEQERPVRRRVAIKLIKLGMDTKEVVARFESERQALALMNHPNIAKVFDAGATPAGRPYFVMEFVAGAAITTYCDQQRLTTRERLELFLRVCAAIEHAHQKGIIHRDLKPSNVLVAMQDGRPEPKIIDFGIAKATNQRLTDRTLYTRTGQLIGTPEYMSPEQARSSGLDVDTRTDIYSAGVLLYQLLVGAVPVKTPRDPKVGYDRIVREICDTEPPRPSYQLTGHETDTSELAMQRRTDPSTLRRELVGDLDWIVLKTLEKDRTRRYQTMTELAEDVRRFLGDLPVLAGPPSRVYRLRKFIRRHRVQVLAGAVVLLSLVGGLVASLVSGAHARAAQRLEAARAEEARRVTEFMVNLFQQADPGRTAGEDVPVRHVLRDANRRIERELRDQPGVRSRLLATMGRVLSALGSYDEAERDLRDAIDTASLSPDTLPEQLIEMRLSLAEVQLLNGRYAETERLSSQCLEQVRAHPEPSTLLELRALRLIGAAQHFLTRFADAERTLNEALQLFAERGTADPGTITAVRMDLGNLALETRRYEDARRLFEDSVEALDARWNNAHPNTIDALINLSTAYLKLDRIDEAERTLDRALEMAHRLYAEDHPVVAYVHDAFSDLLAGQRRFAEAEEHLLRTLSIREKLLHAEHPKLAEVLNDLGSVRLDLNDTGSAVAYLSRARAIYEKSFSSDHAHLATALVNEANALRWHGETRRALTLAERGVAMMERVGHPTYAWSLARLADVYVDLDRWDEATELFERAIALFEVEAPGDRERGWCMVQLARLHNQGGDGRQGEFAASNARDVLLEHGHHDDLYHALALLHVGWGRSLQGRSADAVAPLQESAALFEELYPDGHPLAAFPLDLLGYVLARSDPERALDHARAGLELRRRFLGRNALLRLRSENNVGAILILLGRDDDARPHLEEALRGWREATTEPHDEFAASLFHMAKLEMRADNPDAAARLAAECLEHHRALLPEGHAQIGHTAHLLGVASMRLERFEAAEQRLEEAWAIFGSPTRESTDGGTARETVLRDLVSLYEAWNRPDDAAVYRRLLDGH